MLGGKAWGGPGRAERVAVLRAEGKPEEEEQERKKEPSSMLSLLALEDLLNVLGSDMIKASERGSQIKRSRWWSASPPAKRSGMGEGLCEVRICGTPRPRRALH